MGKPARYLLTMLVCAITPLLAGADAAPVAGAIDDARMLAASSEPDNWMVNGGDYAGRHWSPLTAINETNVAQLGPAWSFDFDTFRGQESEPIVVDGVMYVSSAWSKVYALDAATGRQLWAYDPQTPKEAGVNACCDVVNRGVAVYKGKVYFGTIDARLIALDAKTGKVVWDVQTGEKGRMYTITGAPRVVRDKIIIGNGGAEFDVRGYVSAYDAQTGRRVWRFYTVPGEPGVKDGEISDGPLETMARKTWFGDVYWKAGGGGTAWNSLVYDPEMNQLLIGTGNGTPWNRSHRSEGKGDNLFLCSVLAVDPDTGKYKWHYQENPGETWDYNATQPMILADLTIDGKARKVVMHSPKNGFFYVIDRTNGKLISATPLVEHITWASGIDLITGRPIETPGAHYEKAPFMASPGPGGAHNWHPMALSPQTGLVYLPLNESGFLYRNTPTFTIRHGGPFNDALEHGVGAGAGGPTTMPPAKLPAWLEAWDPVARKSVWRVPGAGGGVLATAGNLVFQGRGRVTGDLNAYRATDGKVLWTHHTPNGVMPGPISYSVGGEQYIAVATGLGGAGVGMATDPAQPQVGRVVAFKLGGKAVLPADPGPPPPFNPSTREIGKDQIALGGARYSEFCFRCHGVPDRASNVVPDLRRSALLQSPEAWRALVIEGALKHKGMIGWKAYLSAPDAEAIRDYIDSEAQIAAGTRRRPAAPSAPPSATQ